MEGYYMTLMIIEEGLIEIKEFYNIRNVDISHIDILIVNIKLYKSNLKKYKYINTKEISSRVNTYRKLYDSEVSNMSRLMKEKNC